MSNELQLDRMELQQRETHKLLNEHIIAQTKKNGELDAHLKNHTKITKCITWVIALGISLGVIKGTGG